MLAVRPYVPGDASAWDAVIDRSRNGNMLHRRGYMDYHADRFVDASLVVEKGGRMIAVFPANLRGDVVVSHAGLTYAGLIATHALRAESTLEAFERIGEHCRSLGAGSVLYKAVPHVFHRYPADEDLYALHRLGAQLARRDVASVIALQEGVRFSPERRRSIARAGKAGMTLRSDGDPHDFHALLEEVLHRHGATPTHSLEELRLLQRRFPGQIVLHEVHDDTGLLAGTVVYDFGALVHTQYLAVSERGRRLDALSLLLARLIGHTYANRRYFSFGISTESEGRVLNGGLIGQKERFGARAVVHDFYEWFL